MKSVRLVLLVLVCLFSFGARAWADPPPPYAVPPGWIVRTAADGTVLLVPPDLSGNEGVLIALLPVIDLPADPAQVFAGWIRSTVGQGKLIDIGQEDHPAHGPYAVYRRGPIVVQEVNGSFTWRYCALSVLEGRGQFILFVASSPALLQKYGPTAERFGRSCNFAQREMTGPRPVSSERDRTPEDGAPDSDARRRVRTAMKEALQLQAQGTYEQALERYRQVELLIRGLKRFPHAKPATAEAIFEGEATHHEMQLELGIQRCTLNAGHFEDASQIANRRINAATAQTDPFLLAYSYVTLGSARFYLLDYDGARAGFREARQIIERRCDDLIPNVERILARVKQGGQVSETDASEIRNADTWFTECRPLYAKISNVFAQLGLFEEIAALYSSPSLERLDRILATPEFRKAYVAGMEDVGTGELLAQLDDALGLIRFSRKTDLFNALCKIAEESGRDEDWQKTRASMDELKAVAATMPRDPFVQSSLHVFLGTLEMGRKQWPEARKELELGLDLAGRIDKQLFRDSARQPALVAYARVCVEMGDGKRALTALAEAEKLPVPVDLALASLFRVARARALALEGRAAEASASYSAALAALEQERNGVRSSELLKNFYRRRSRMYEDAISFYQQRNLPQEALAVMEMMRARTLRDMLAQTPIKKGVTPDLLARLEAIRKEEQQRQIERNRVLAGSSATLGAATRQSSNGNADRVRIVEAALKARPEFAELKEGVAAQIGNLMQEVVEPGLDSDSIAVEYFFGTRSAIVTTLDSNRKATVRALPTTRDEVTEAVHDFRSAAQSGSDTWVQDSDRLYRLLIEPVAKEIAGKRVVVIVPNGITTYLPWSALAPRGKPGLLDEHEIVVLPSLSTLRFCRAKNKHRMKTGVAFALGGLSRAGMIPLPGTTEEVKAIAAAFPSMQAAIESDFTFKNVLEKTRDADIIHFATHGFVNAKDPEQSGILTADGQLYLKEIFNLDLHADLVVLSACDTGLGRIYSGDELHGLTRGFIYAGTPSIIATLWKVDDKATARFMVLFYEALKAGKGKSASLRDAQLALRKEYPQALYWAPFTLYGDWK